MPPRSASGLQVLSLLGVMLICLFLIVVNLLFDMAGSCKWICSVGFISLLISLPTFAQLSNKHNESISIVEWLTLGVVSASAKLICDLDIFFASGITHGLISGLKAFNWFSEIGVLVVFFLAASFVVVRKINGYSQAVSNIILSFGLFTAIFNLYILFCGFYWGVSPLLAAATIFRFSWHGIWPVTAIHQNAASTLYHAQGKELFYFVFLICPILVFVGNAVWRLARIINGKTSMTCVLLLILGFSVFFRSGDLGGAVGYIVYDCLHNGNPLNKKLFDCRRRYSWYADSDTAVCYQASATDWEAEIKKNNALILQRSKSRKQKDWFLKNKQHWEQWEMTAQANRIKHLSGNPNATYLIASSRWHDLQERGDFLQAYLNLSKGIFIGGL